MNTASTLLAPERDPIIVTQQDVVEDDSTPIGNSVVIVEMSNVFVGSIEEILEDASDSRLADSRMAEETEPIEKVFSELGIS